MGVEVRGIYRRTGGGGKDHHLPATAIIVIFEIATRSGLVQRRYLRQLALRCAGYPLLLHGGECRLPVCCRAAVARKITADHQVTFRRQIDGVCSMDSAGYPLKISLLHFAAAASRVRRAARRSAAGSAANVIAASQIASTVDMRVDNFLPAYAGDGDAAYWFFQRPDNGPAVRRRQTVFAPPAHPDECWPAPDVTAHQELRPLRSSGAEIIKSYSTRQPSIDLSRPENYGTYHPGAACCCRSRPPENGY